MHNAYFLLIPLSTGSCSISGWYLSLFSFSWVTSVSCYCWFIFIRFSRFASLFCLSWSVSLVSLIVCCFIFVSFLMPSFCFVYHVLVVVKILVPYFYQLRRAYIKSCPSSFPSSLGSAQLTPTPINVQDVVSWPKFPAFSTLFGSHPSRCLSSSFHIPLLMIISQKTTVK